MSKHIYAYLALGDSYTIGEGVPLFECFPYQAVHLLRKMGYSFHAPEIIAKTGFTSFELIEQILHTPLQEKYDFVTLLIGVNNQYRGLPVEEFREQYAFLVQKAIHFAGGHEDHVIALSIPDWGATPFAADRDSQFIEEQINVFNTASKVIAEEKKIHFIDITPQTKSVSADEKFLSADGLHYSGKLYATWAALLSKKINACLNLHI